MTEPLTIIFVDDNALVRDMVCSALKSMGHHALGLASFEAPRLQSVIEHERPHAVILDVMMPMLRGDLLAKTLAPKGARSYSLLLCSGLDESELERRATACSADGYVVKSTSFLTLARDIVRTVGERRR